MYIYVDVSVSPPLYLPGAVLGLGLPDQPQGDAPVLAGGHGGGGRGLAALLA